MTVATAPTTAPAPTLTPEAFVDTRRLTEHDPDFLRLKAKYSRRLMASVRICVHELQQARSAGVTVQPHRMSEAINSFVQRHLGLLKQAYLEAHTEGQVDYWHSVSRVPGKQQLRAADSTLLRRRMSFYAPSVAKMAREMSVLAQRQSLPPQLATEASSTIVLDEPSTLDDWLQTVPVRIDLQASLTWPGLQDGYLGAGASDVANPYADVWWILEPGAHHCDDCPTMALGSPYQAPGSGSGNELWNTPGDGNTACGAACHCSVDYEMPTGAALSEYAQAIVDVWNTWYPDGAPADVFEQQTAMALPNAGQAMTPEQAGLLDNFRAAYAAWDAVRGDLPAAPEMFGTSPVVQLPAWDELTPEQQLAIQQLAYAITEWQIAGLDDGAGGEEGSDQGQLRDEQRGGLLSNNYPRQSHGRFGFGPGRGPNSTGEGERAARPRSTGSGNRGSGRRSSRTRVVESPVDEHAAHEADRLARLAQARSDLAEAHTRTVAAETKRNSIGQQQIAAVAKHRDELYRLEGTRRHLEEQAKEQIIAERATRAPRTHERYMAAKQEFERLDPQREQMERELDIYGSHSPHTVQREIEQEVRDSVHYDGSTRSYRAYQRALQNSPRYGEWQHAQEQLDAYQKLYSKTYAARGNMLRYEEQLLGNRLENSAHVTQHPDFLAQKAIADDAESRLNSLNTRWRAANDDYLRAESEEVRLSHRVDLLQRTTENGVTFSNDSARGAPERVFGRSLSTDEIKSLAGGRSEDYVTIEAHGNSRSFSVRLESEDGTRTGDFEVSRHGDRIIVQVGTVRNTGASGAGVAHDITGSLETMRGLGVNEIRATAARGAGGHEHGFNGYYTWARLGFTGRIPRDELTQRAQAEFGSGVTRVEQIMGFGARGRNWWKEHGTTWHATFNFDENSYSMRTLKGWQQAVGRNG